MGSSDFLDKLCLYKSSYVICPCCTSFLGIHHSAHKSLPTFILWNFMTEMSKNCWNMQIWVFSVSSVEAYIKMNWGLNVLVLTNAAQCICRLPSSSEVPSVVTGGSFFSWGTKFRYSGRVEREILEDAGPLRKEEPAINRSLRSSSLRRKASSVPATPSTPIGSELNEISKGVFCLLSFWM
jgi:FERM adjacent (FA).